MSGSTVATQQAIVSPEVFVPQANEWVQLRDALSDYSANEALLLCEAETDQWVAWVPNIGQVKLGREQMVQTL